MNIIKYGDILTVEEAVEKNEPMFAVISFDGEEAIVSHANKNELRAVPSADGTSRSSLSVEHNILLKKAGKSGNDIDKYFRIVFDKDGADWTFVCPPDYKNIPVQQRRIAQFYKDGFAAISNFLAEFGYFSDINIPQRYRRHFKIMSEE